MATVFVEIRMLKDAPAIVGSDMKVYGPFTAGKVYAIPKENARVFIKQGVAKATREEAKKPTLKEMFKGEVLTPYIEAALVKPLVETDEEKVIAQIVENCNYWASNICKRETLEKYCVEKKGVGSPGEIIDDLIRRGVVYTPKPGYIGLTEPEKYGLPPIEREIKLTGPDTARLADYFFKKCDEKGIMGSLHKAEFEEAMDIYKTYEENLPLMDKLVEELVAPPDRRRRALLSRTEELIAGIQEERLRG